MQSNRNIFFKLVINVGVQCRIKIAQRSADR